MNDYHFSYLGHTIFDCTTTSEKDAIRQFRARFSEPAEGWGAVTMYVPISDRREWKTRLLTEDGA